MKFLKGLALGLLGFLLFPSLVVFSSAFTINSTILNPHFLVSELDRLDVSALTEEILSQVDTQADFPEELRVALVDTIAELEPVVKEQVSAAIYPVYDYLLGKSENLDLKQTLGDTLLSPEFVTSLLDKLDLSSLAAGFLGEQLTEEIPEEMGFLVEQMDDIIAELDPTIKEELSTAAEPIMDYLLGKSRSLNVVISLGPVVEQLEDSLREHLLESTPAELKPYFKEFLIEQITEGIPAEMEHLADYAITDEWAEEQVNVAINPVLNYLLGKSQSLNVVISLGPVVENLRVSMREEFLESPPPELAGFSQTQLEQYFDEYFQELAGGIPSTLVIDESMLGADIPAQIDELFRELTEAIPSTFVIDESMLGTEVPAQIAEALAQAEEALAEARLYVGYFQLGYKALIGFILLLILGIILISRQVRDITRRLGSVFLTFAVPACLGLFAIRYFAEIQAWILQLLKVDIDIPAQLQALILQSVNNFLAPVRMLSLGILIAGVALIIVSIVYKPRQPSD